MLIQLTRMLEQKALSPKEIRAAIAKVAQKNFKDIKKLLLSKSGSLEPLENLLLVKNGKAINPSARVTSVDDMMQLSGTMLKAQVGLWVKEERALITASGTKLSGYNSWKKDKCQMVLRELITQVPSDIVAVGKKAKKSKRKAKTGDDEWMGD